MIKLFAGILNIAPFVRDRRRDCILLLMIFIANDGRPPFAEMRGELHSAWRIFSLHRQWRRIMKKI